MYDNTPKDGLLNRDEAGKFYFNVAGKNAGFEDFFKGADKDHSNGLDKKELATVLKKLPGL